MSAPLSGDQFLLGGAAFTVQSPEESYSLTLANDYTRHELRAGDQWYGDAGSSGKERCELNSTGWPLDTELWFAYSFKISGTLPNTWSIINQMQQRPENLDGRTETVGKPPAWSVRFENGNLRLGARGDTAEITTVHQEPIYYYDEPWTGNDVEHDLVARVKLHWTHGEMQVWLDGTELVDETGMCFGYNDIAGVSMPSWKIGLYRQGADETTVTEFCNIQPPTTSSLLSRVTNTPAWHT